MVATVAENPAPASAGQIRALLRQQKFAEVLAASEALLAGAPEHRDGLLLCAIAQRRLGLVDDGPRDARTPSCAQPALQPIA